MDLIFFHTLAPKSPWVQVGMEIRQRSVVVVYNPKTKILAAQFIEQNDNGIGRSLGPPTAAIVEDNCKVFEFIAIELKADRLLDCDVFDASEIMTTELAPWVPFAQVN